MSSSDPSPVQTAATDALRRWFRTGDAQRCREVAQIVLTAAEERPAGSVERTYTAATLAELRPQLNQTTAFHVLEHLGLPYDLTVRTRQNTDSLEWRVTVQYATNPSRLQTLQQHLRSGYQPAAAIWGHFYGYPETAVTAYLQDQTLSPDEAAAYTDCEDAALLAFIAYSCAPSEDCLQQAISRGQTYYQVLCALATEQSVPVLRVLADALYAHGQPSSETQAATE